VLLVRRREELCEFTSWIFKIRSANPQLIETIAIL